MSDRKRHTAAQGVPRAPIAPDPLPAQGDVAYPAHWTPGQLLDLRKFTDGSYRCTILGEEPDFQTRNFIEFPSSYAAQQFVSIWYTPAKARVW
jgi:hypothetical protein